MKTLVVPKDKSPLEFLLEMEGEINNACIILHNEVFKRLSKSCDSFLREPLADGSNQYCMKWDATKEHSKVRISCDEIKDGGTVRVTYIKFSNNRNNYYVPTEPEEFFYIELE